MSEFRAYRDTNPELRGADGDTPTLEGYAAVFGRYSQNLGGFVEVIERGAFSDVVGRDATVALFNHDPDNLLGTIASGTLTIAEDDIGLRYSVALDPSDPDAQRVMAKARTGKLRGSSFSFSLGEDGDEWTHTEQGFPLRRIRSAGVVSMPDVGPVTFPAYRATEDDALAVSLRSLADTTGRDMAELIDAAKRDALADTLDTPGDEPEVDDPTASAGGEQPRSTVVRRWGGTRRNH